MRSGSDDFYGQTTSTSRSENSIMNGKIHHVASLPVADARHASRKWNQRYSSHEGLAEIQTRVLIHYPLTSPNQTIFKSEQPQIS